MNAEQKLKHDFTNNGIRIEVLNRLIVEKLENSNPLEEEHLKDLKDFLKFHLELLEKLN